jgi:mannosyl-3-phosphoglycerate phosphatase
MAVHAASQKESARQPFTPIVIFIDIGDRLPEDGDSRRDVEALAEEHIAVVLCSSMTRAQLEAYKDELGIEHPFVCESGAAVLIPHEYFPFGVLCNRDLPGHQVIEFGRPYEEVVALLRRTAVRLNIRVIGFNDLSVERVASECGVSLSQAHLAKLREYDEPFRILDDRPDVHDRLWRALQASRLTCTYHGAYEHVGSPVDIATGVHLLTTLYRRAYGGVVTAAIGTTLSSASFLHRVKFPFVVETGQSRDHLITRVPRLQTITSNGTWLVAAREVAALVRERHAAAHPSWPAE